MDFSKKLNQQREITSKTKNFKITVMNNNQERGKNKYKEGTENTKKEDIEWVKAEGKLVADVYQTASDLVVRIPIAGIDVSEIDVRIENRMLIIKGERKEPEKVGENEYLSKECYWGKFSREISLPQEADIARASADFKDCILTIRIPLIQKIRTRKIKVKDED